MTKFKGQLHKMAVQAADPVQYSLVLKEEGKLLEGLPKLNDYLGKVLTIEVTGNINCIACKRKISKTFQQGYCFPCMQKLACCDMCILKPENCHFHKNTCREPEWGVANCFVPHIVYLANSSGIKVGITREINVPSRWIDQGASQALAILRVHSRFQAGLLEVAFAKHVADKTDWRKMLLNNTATVDLATKRNELFFDIAAEIQTISAKFKFGDIEMLTAELVHNFNYPILSYPQKINTLSLEKTHCISDILLGIKGQYLIFASGVINLRKYTGFEVLIH